MQEEKEKLEGLKVIEALFSDDSKDCVSDGTKALAAESYRAAFYYYKMKQIADKPLTAAEYRQYSAKVRSRVRSLALDAAKAIEDNPGGYVSIVRGYLRRTDRLRKNPGTVFA